MHPRFEPRHQHLLAVILEVPHPKTNSYHLLKRGSNAQACRRKKQEDKSKTANKVEMAVKYNPLSTAPKYKKLKMPEAFS